MADGRGNLGCSFEILGREGRRAKSCVDTAEDETSEIGMFGLPTSSWPAWVKQAAIGDDADAGLAAAVCRVCSEGG